jgi:hypothetical protein
MVMGTMTDNVNPKIKLQLHPDGVAAPAHIAAQTCREIVDFYFAALATADLSKNPPAPEGTFFRFGFSGPELSTTDRRSLHENWILAKVFQDLMRGVRASLEEAFFFTELIAAGTITAQSSSTLDEILAPFRMKTADLNFPPLLALHLLRKRSSSRNAGQTYTQLNCARFQSARDRTCRADAKIVQLSQSRTNRSSAAATAFLFPHFRFQDLTQ